MLQRFVTYTFSHRAFSSRLKIRVPVRAHCFVYWCRYFSAPAVLICNAPTRLVGPRSPCNIIYIATWDRENPFVYTHTKFTSTSQQPSLFTLCDALCVQVSCVCFVFGFGCCSMRDEYARSLKPRPIATWDFLMEILKAGILSPQRICFRPVFFYYYYFYLRKRACIMNNQSVP